MALTQENTIAYTALNNALEKEKKLIELMALYQQSLIKIKELEDKIEELNK